MDKMVRELNEQKLEGFVARMLDEVASMPGVKGIMLTFDDFFEGLDKFGERIQPLMACRQDRLPLAA